jgi:HAE1 family hydrophobic/amphiphilic exporter-1
MKLADVSIRRPVFATMMIAALVVFGAIGYSRLGVDLFPNVEFPLVTVTAVYPGADPEAVETKVITKLEDAVAGISGVKALNSVSLENVGQVIIQFELETKVDEAAQEVRDKVSAVLRELPKEVEPPMVEKLDLGAAPILSLVLSGQIQTRALTDVADDEIKPRLQKILGVGGIDIVGGKKREIQVWVRADLLAKYKLTVQDVFMALAAQNLEVPGGRFRDGQTELIVKTKGEVHTARGIAELIVPVPTPGAPIRIRDIARVVDSSEEATSYSSLDGTSSVSLVVRKKSGTNATEVARAAKREIEALKVDLAKRGIRTQVVADLSKFIESSVEDVEFDLVFGGVLAVVIILLFLRNFRTTLISAVAIPTSVVATLAFVYWMGFTLNWLTLLALSLSIGILIDDAIVVIENIYRHVEQEGREPVEAAHTGTAEIGLAVLATTFSIVAVFVPVAFMKGMIGRFFYEFGVTVSVAVLISLFVSFTLTPMLSSRFIRISERPNALFRLIERLLKGLDEAYRRTLAAALRNRAIVVVLAVGVLGGSVYLGSFLKQEFVPMFDRSEFNINIELPAGKSLLATKRFADQVAADVRRLPGVEQTFVRVGGGLQQKVNAANLYVKIVERAGRAFTQRQMMDHVRRMLARRPGAKISVEDVPIVSGSGMRHNPIQFNIRGQKLQDLAAVSRKVMAGMREAGGIVDIDSTYRAGKPELNIKVDRNRAAALGVPVASIATTIRALMGGDKATQMRQGGDLFDVRVRLQAKDRVRPEDLKRLQVRSSLGKMIDLSNLVTIKRGSGPTEITRGKRQRQVTILANLQDKPMGEALKEIRAVAARVVPEGYSTDFTGMGEVMEDSFREMFFALFLAIVMVYMILASQFNSFIHPLTIMLSLPMSLIGAIGALLISGNSLSIFGMIGIIMLMGLVTKNAILLVDYTNTLRSRGLSRDEALLRAGPVRLRPILMTTAAMVFGMLPVALGMGEGAEVRAPMAVCVIGGLITSTLLTLLVVPVVYSLLDGLSARVAGRSLTKELETDAA